MDKKPVREEKIAMIGGICHKSMLNFNIGWDNLNRVALKVILTTIIIFASLPAEEIRLKDGQSLLGTILYFGAKQITILVGNDTINIDRNQISEIEYTKFPNVYEKKPAAAENPVGSGYLYVETNPSGARVQIDSNYYGKTPITIEGVKAGIKLVKVSRFGCKTLEKTVRIIPNEVTQVRFTLPSDPGNLTVLTTPPKALLFINNKLYGETPITVKNIDAGRYFLEVKIGNSLFGFGTAEVLPKKTVVKRISLHAVRTTDVRGSDILLLNFLVSKCRSLMDRMNSVEYPRSKIIGVWKIENSTMQKVVSFEDSIFFIFSRHGYRIIPLDSINAVLEKEGKNFGWLMNAQRLGDFGHEHGIDAFIISKVRPTDKPGIIEWWVSLFGCSQKKIIYTLHGLMKRR